MHYFGSQGQQWRQQDGDVQLARTLMPSGFIVYCLISTSPVCSPAAAVEKPRVASTCALRAAARSIFDDLRTEFPRL